METAAPMGGLDAEVVRLPQEELMLILLFACTEFVGTDYRSGWREVQCEVRAEDSGDADETIWQVPVDGVRPVSIWCNQDGLWLGGGGGHYDAEAGAMWTCAGTECRAWVAE